MAERTRQARAYARTNARAYGRGYGRTTARTYGAAYTYGSEAPELYPQVPARRRPQRPAPVRTRPSEEELQRNRAAVERNRERASRLNPALITFMVTMVIIMGVFLVEYLTLQSKVSSTLSEISTMETHLQTLKASNDETLSQIEASVNLDEIKYKAITELGMSYATDDQIIPFANDSSDYVHQVTEVGK